MSNINKKKEVLMSKKERLMKELLETESALENVMEEEWKEQGENIVRNIDALLELVPTHDDGTIDEGHDEPDCLRCILLNTQMKEEWDYKKYGLNIELEIKKQSDKKEDKKKETKPKKKNISKKANKNKTKMIKTELSENQKKAIEMGILNYDEEDNKNSSKKKRVLEVNEEEADLPDEWSYK